MPGLTAGLNIGLTGLAAAQNSLDVIGHNIANVNTPGYSRQVAQLGTAGSSMFGGLVYGTGVNLQAIQGIRDQLLNLQITVSTAQQSGAQTRYQGLQAISSVFTDDGTSGISSQLNAFFTSLQKVAAQPEDPSLRTNLVGAAQTLISTLQTKYQSLRDAQTTADQQVAALVPTVNTLTSQIAALNKKLAGEVNPDQDNTSIDQRQDLANQLAKIVGIQTYIDSKGQMNINLDGGTAPLVIGSTAYTMTSIQNNTPPATAPFYNSVEVSLNGTAPFTDVTASITNGEMGAQLDLRDNLIAGYEKQMDELAAGVAYNINSLNSTGYSLDGVQHGLDFFQNAAGNTAHLPTGIQVPPDVGAQVPANDYKGMVLALSVNAAIIANPSLFAASSTGAAGDNKNAQAMVALQTSGATVDSTGAGPAASTTGPFSSFVAGLVTKASTDAAQWKITSTNVENITTALTTQRDSVSAVDLDTEAANLITFQRGYQASARFVSVISQLTEQLINNLGA
ncbi:flagellar hook-associated protein FlgK [Mesoterricola silvestris]|uniref:Flagellar hook-associated protein 1 n=1 Tax=Mesoterricola silvestris TaxID=2927979 RepID=A0AA48GPJ4_9BACT|nr:flagellar hook-associated protein FlgK [Mesoterricola silvestris]BDU73345.1 flagellar hook-associated protein 1 [Mesoterricola silvestris]